MEHRWNRRKSVNINVLLKYKSRGLIRATIRNVSLGGMLVAPALQDLQVNAPVEVVLPGSGAWGAKQHLKALVVRVNEEGVGLMLREYNRAALEALNALLVRTGPRSDNPAATLIGTL